MENAAEWDTPLWSTPRTQLVSSREFHVLAAAASMPNPSQKELSRVLGVDPNVMVGLIDRLEEEGLAIRERNPRDRRRYIVTTTEKAARVLEEARESVANAEAEFFATLSEQEVRTLHELSGRLLATHPRVTKQE